MRFERGAHDVARAGFAGPDLELAEGLLKEHFGAGNHYASLGLGAFEQQGFDRVIDHIEDEAGGDFVMVEDALVCMGRHAKGCGMNEDIEAARLSLLEGEGFTFDRAGERLGESGIASGNGDASAGVMEGESS